MTNDPYTDDKYDDTYREVHGDEPARDQYTDETTEDTFFPSAAGRSLYPPSWGLWPGGGTVEGEYDEEGDYGAREPTRAGEYEEDRGSWWDEGLIGLLLVAGVVLFLFPEPATSGLGIVLIAVGVLAWVIDWLA